MKTKPNSGTVSVSRELLPCPFCGSSDVKIVTDDGIHFAQCCKCEATGPTGFKRGEEDDVDWNSRAQPADQQGEENYPPCDYCGMVPDYHPWHGSGMLRGVENRHIHACHACRALLPAHDDQTATAKVDDPTPGFTKWFNEHGKEGVQSELGVEELMEGAYAAGCRAKLKGGQP